MGEIDNIAIRQWNHDVRHRSVVAASGIALVFAHRLHEIVLALAGQARNILFPGKVLVMAKIASMLLDQRARASSRAGFTGSAAGLGGGSCAITFAMPRKSSSLRPFIIAFIGSTTRSRSRNMKSWRVR